MHVNMFGNVSGIKLRPSEINLFEEAKKQNNKPVSIRDTSWGAKLPEVKVNISEEGLRALHGDPSMTRHTEALKKSQEELQYWNDHQPIESFSTKINRLANEELSKRVSDEKPSVEEKAVAFLKAFASVHDEVSRDYDTGNRIRFISVNEEDQDFYPDSADGFHRLTKNEELKILQNQFEEMVDRRFGPERQKLNENVAKAVNELQAVKQKYGLGNVVSYEPEKIPDGLADRMKKASQLYASNDQNGIRASKSFTEQYALQMSGKLDIASILNGIKIFG